MKTLSAKTLLLLLINLFTLHVCRAQEVDYVQVGIMKADYDRRAVLYLGNSKIKAEAILGPPTTKSVYYSEMDDTNLDLWTYGSNKLYFDAKGLVLYHIADPTIAIGKSYATSFKVGTNRGVNATFHGMPVDVNPGKSQGLSYNSIALAGLKSSKTPIDWAVEVLFDANGNVFRTSVILTN